MAFMNEPDFLNARNALREGKVDMAISMYEKLLIDPDRKPLAEYTLGIIYSLEGPKKDKSLAKSYFEQAAEAGHVMAIYQVGRIAMVEEDFEEAFFNFQAIHDLNPSAAFWCYWLIKHGKAKDCDGNDWVFYRDIASSQGHMLAKRDELIDEASGEKGRWRIPAGMFKLLRLIYKFRRSDKQKDKYIMG